MKLRPTLYALLITLFTATFASAAPQLVVERGNYNFGKIPVGKKVHHAFRIKNGGDAPLQIKKIEVSCGCTAATPSASVIAPGKSATVEVTFDSTSFSGKVHKTVTLTSNAGKTPTYVFNIEGTVTEELQVTPRQVSLGLLNSSTPTETKVNITNHGDGTVKILSVNVTSASLQIKPVIEKGKLEPGETGKIGLSVLAKPGAKVLSGYLHIVTTSDRQKEITVPVYGSGVK